MKKFIAFIRWFFFAAILQTVLIPLSYILYPLAYVLRDFLRRNRPYTYPLYIFLDDEGDYGESWWQIENGIVLEELSDWQKFKVAYRWSVIRNPAWNQYSIIKPKQGGLEIKEMSGFLSVNGQEVDITNFAVFKWENEAGQYTDNQGEYLSYRFSTLGRSFVWYIIDGTLYFRSSFAGRVYSKGWKTFYRLLLSVGRVFTFKFRTIKEVWKNPIFLEKHLGTNNRRYTIRLKIKSPAKLRGFPSD